jgi:hypothetical protein
MTALSDLAADVRRFYARQLRHVDDGAVEECAATFTPDAELVRHAPEQRMRSQDAAPRRDGRAAIAAGLRKVIEQRARTGVVRRHWLGDLVVQPQGDTVQARYYLMALDTPRGGRPGLRNSTVVEDELVRSAAGWRVRRRTVTHDDVP